MTERVILGLPVEALDEPSLACLRSAGAGLDRDRPRVASSAAYRWWFVDPVDCDEPHIVQQALGCDAPADGCLTGGRWTGASSVAERVRARVDWWHELAQQLLENHGDVALVRHSYTGRFDREPVTPRTEIVVRIGELARESLRQVPRDVALVIQPDRG